MNSEFYEEALRIIEQLTDEEIQAGLTEVGVEWELLKELYVDNP